MRAVRAYSGRQFVFAVCLSALLGWLYFVLPLWIQQGPGRLAIAALVGIPIALAVCWIFVAPFLWLLMARPVGWRLAARSGFIIALLMAIAGIVLARIQGWRAAHEVNSYFQMGGGDHAREIDGMLTPYGWLMTAWESLLFVLAGTVAALIVRAIIGRGRRPEPEVPEVEPEAR
ncbi:MAG: hypothetical protein EOP22_16645 [Hyphomicrobiales bacterium]|nr:MAG: hypothetical protein EOP22_16645 [Hyphomicrobiales bacterium]